MASELKTSRRGAVEPFTIIEGPEAWTAADYAGRTDWINVLSPAHVAELDAAVAGVERRGWPTRDIHKITRSDFPLPSLGPYLEGVRDEVVAGRGFALIRGVPVERYDRRQTAIAYWGMGLYWGRASSNNKKGHMIGHIKDIGQDPSAPTTRLYATHAAQPFHNDSADIVTLLCLKNARSGGLSSWSSSVSVHNAILRDAPHLAAALAGPDWYYDRKGEIPPGKKPFFRMPVFNYHKGQLSVNYSDNYFLLSQRHAEVPRLTADQYEAMRVFNELAASDALRLDYMLQPGEIQLLNNHTQLHARSEFVDWDHVDARRHLLRLWIAPPVERELPEVYAEIYGGSLEVGNRGGIHVEGTQEHVTLEAE
ncbi:SAT17 [Scenedesmus sp. PABB004]|nr:SAT17 [Scenedesmus sp. PABB004]